MRGTGWRLTLAAVILGVVLANADSCGDGRLDSAPDRVAVAPTEEVS